MEKTFRVSIICSVLHYRKIVEVQAKSAADAGKKALAENHGYDKVEYAYAKSCEEK